MSRNMFGTCCMRTMSLQAACYRFMMHHRNLSSTASCISNGAAALKQGRSAGTNVYTSIAGPVPNLMQTSLYIWPFMYNSIYGRFLLLQLAGVGDVLVLNVILSLYDVVGRLSTR